ncbi:MAG: hypothetical protein QM723_05295 [Myxococcaceae bacterium]
MLDILKRLFPGQTLRFTLASSLDGVQGTVETSPEQFPNGQPLVDLVKALRAHDFITCVTFNVHLLSNGQVQVLSFSCPANQPAGQFTIYQPSGQFSRAIQATLVDELRKAFTVSDFATATAASNDDVYRKALHEREVMVAELASVMRKLQDQLAEMAVSERENRRQQEAEIQAQHRKQSEEFAAQRTKLTQDLDERRRADQAELDSKREAFREEQGRFETQKATYMRRDLLKRIEAALAEAQKPQTSAATNSKRRGVHVALGGLIAVSGTAAAVCLKVLLTEAFDWHMLLPLGSSLAVLVSTLVYYVRWMDRWFREHAEQEFGASKYKADMLRASWIAELSAEIREHDNAELQPALLSALTHGLFVTPGSPPLRHPLEAVTGLAERLSEIQANKDGLVVKTEVKK